MVLRLCLAFAASLLAACAGTTSIQDSHPSLAAAGGAAKVYFIRPDPGFRGVMDRPIAISLDDKPLLDLAKGQYTLLSLKPGKAMLRVDSHTVVGTTNTLVPVSIVLPIDFDGGTTEYLYFALTPRGTLAGAAFIPHKVPRERALELVRGLAPVGHAIREPLP